MHVMTVALERALFIAPSFTSFVCSWSMSTSDGQTGGMYSPEGLALARQLLRPRLPHDMKCFCGQKHPRELRFHLVGGSDLQEAHAHS